MGNERAASISKGERIQSLDLLRGFALLGILLVNILDFSGPALYRNSLIHSTGAADRIAEVFVFVFAQTSFYPMFAFLFGAGAVMFYSRLEARGQSPSRYFSRRMTGLLIIGVLHAFLIWHGDILITYAVIGFIFMLFIQRSARSLAKWGLSLILIPSSLFGLLMIGEDGLQVEENGTERITDVYQTGTFLELIRQRAEDWYYVNNFLMAPFLLLSILPMFLLGGYAMKSGWFEKNPSVETAKKWIKIAAAAGPAGLLIKGMPVFFPASVFWSYMHQSIGGPLLAFFYISILLLASYTFREKRIVLFQLFTYAGRASMSNYLLQSVICTALFYSYGLGLYGKTGSLQALLIGLSVYAVLVFMSFLWFKRFEQGPAEKWWRRFTYRNV
ncbi:DUF418 domain-containing protein [Metabacillus sp. 84]|uniref:DUF418 domain-containing protein n=1 Tax=Metabacillus sp. 84 TaxID=3404705 RepID=UPI003CF03CAF